MLSLLIPVKSSLRADSTDPISRVCTQASKEFLEKKESAYG